MNNSSLKSLFENILRLLKGVRDAMNYAEDYYIKDVSAVAEVLSFFNGYEGSPDIHAIEKQVSTALNNLNMIESIKDRLVTNTSNNIIIRTFQGQSGTWYAVFVKWNSKESDMIGTGVTEMEAIIDLCKQEQESIDRFNERLSEDEPL